MSATPSVSVTFRENDPRSSRITFDPAGPITITASSGQVTYNLKTTDNATKFATSVSPIQFFDDLGQGINTPVGARVNRLDDNTTQINLTVPAGAAAAEFHFKVVLQQGSATFFRSADPTIVIMRPGE